jgi:hypothetical protein
MTSSQFFFADGPNDYSFENPNTVFCNCRMEKVADLLTNAKPGKLTVKCRFGCAQPLLSLGKQTRSYRKILLIEYGAKTEKRYE